MAPRIVNLGEWRAHLLGRLRRQVASPPTPNWPSSATSCAGTPATSRSPRWSCPAPADVVVPLRLRPRHRELAFFSTVATFGTPLDITVAELAIESFFPADRTTAAVLRANAGH